MDLRKKIDMIDNKEDFIYFINLLAENLKNNPIEWSNNNLIDYLDAIANWTEDMDGYYVNNNLPIPTNVNWKVFANILVAAKSYE